MSRPLGDVRLAALMLDGIELKGRCCVVCLGVTTDGIKVPLGLWDGSTENKTVVTAHLLSDLVDRGLDVEQGRARRHRRIQGAEGCRARGVRPGRRSAVCPAQGTRRARSPPRARPGRGEDALAEGLASENYELALDGLRLLAGELERTYPGAAASLREGMKETLTLTRLGIRGRLRRTLQSTSPIESMIEIVRRSSRNVKRW